jgi:hypothetical protein
MKSSAIHGLPDNTAIIPSGMHAAQISNAVLRAKLTDRRPADVAPGGDYSLYLGFLVVWGRWGGSQAPESQWTKHAGHLYRRSGSTVVDRIVVIGRLQNQRKSRRTVAVIAHWPR